MEKFVYFGHLITDDGKCDEEIKKRVEISRTTFNKLPEVVVSGQHCHIFGRDIEMHALHLEYC